MEVYRHDRSSYPGIEGDYTLVDEQEWAKKSRGLLVVRNVEPCLVLAAHRFNTGYLGHFRLDTTSYTQLFLQQMLEEVESDPYSQNFTAWVSGASRHTKYNPDAEMTKDLEVHNAAINAAKISTINSLAKIGIDAIRQDWLEDNKIITELAFNSAEEGEIKYLVEDAL